MVDLFAGVCVADYAAGRTWYEQLLGSRPSFIAHEMECVWELEEHRFLYVVEDRERAGHAVVMIFVDDFDALGAPARNPAEESPGRQPPAIAPTTMNGSSPWATRSGSGASGSS